MDIKFKKRILLAMQIHSAINNNLMSVSPTKSIDLHMLAAVCIKSYYEIYFIKINYLFGFFFFLDCSDIL